MAYTTLGVLILWFGWFGFNAGSTLGIASGEHVGYFAYVALTTTSRPRPGRSAACSRHGSLSASRTSRCS